MTDIDSMNTSGGGRGLGIPLLWSRPTPTLPCTLHHVDTRLKVCTPAWAVHAQMSAEELGNLKMAGEAAAEYASVFAVLTPDTHAMNALYEERVRAEESIIKEKIQLHNDLTAARLEVEAAEAAERAAQLNAAVAAAEAAVLKAGGNAAKARAEGKRVRFEGEKANAEAAADGAVQVPGVPAGAPKGTKPVLDTSVKPLPVGPFKSRLDAKDDVLTLLTPKMFRKHTPQAQREAMHQIAVWRSYPRTWMQRGDFFRERENVVLAVRELAWAVARGRPLPHPRSQAPPPAHTIVLHAGRVSVDAAFMQPSLRGGARAAVHSRAITLLLPPITSLPLHCPPLPSSRTHHLTNTSRTRIWRRCGWRASVCATVRNWGAGRLRWLTSSPCGAWSGMGGRPCFPSLRTFRRHPCCRTRCLR
jgi:hypothetical protein